MNFLAHAMLAQQGSDELLLGALIADGIKGYQALAELPKPVRQGVSHHRIVDQTVDRHPYVLSLVSIMPQRRFAAIALDIYWDHCLHQYMSQMSSSSEVADAIKRGHDVISSAPYLPESHASQLHQMVAGQWMARYASLPFTLDAIRGVGQRFRRIQDFNPLCDWLARHDDVLRDRFSALWQDMCRLTRWPDGQLLQPTP